MVRTLTPEPYSRRVYYLCCLLSVFPLFFRLSLPPPTLVFGQPVSDLHPTPTPTELLSDLNGLDRTWHDRKRGKGRGWRRRRRGRERWRRRGREERSTRPSRAVVGGDTGESDKRRWERGVLPSLVTSNVHGRLVLLRPSMGPSLSPDRSSPLHPSSVVRSTFGPTRTSSGSRARLG